MVAAFFLRVVALDRYPAGFTPDEASFGYDAYSILKTGRDQWGKSLPLVLESFGDFKPPLYAYLLIPFVGLFGLERWVVRLPNALVGTLAAYVLFLLVKEIRKGGNLDFGKLKLEVVSAALLAFSPWHIMMSRGAFEANLTTLLMPLGIYLFLKGLRKNKYLMWSSVILGLNLFSYHSAKLVTPLVLVGLIYLYKDKLSKIKDRLFLPAAVFTLFFALTAYSFLIGGGERAKDVNIFNNSLASASQERTAAILEGANPTLARLVHNKYQMGLRKFANNYFQYFSPQYLFTQGPAEATYGMIPGRGVLYWFELPFILGFLLYLAKEKLPRELKLFLLWLIVAPVPAALATGPGYAANRAVIMLPAIQVLLSVGALYLVGFIKERKFKLYSYLFFGISVVFILSFLEHYFVISPRKVAGDMLYGNLEAAEWLRDNSTDKNVIVSKRLSEPHIYIAFASRVDPDDYQEATRDWDYKGKGLGWVDQLPEYYLGKYTFKDVHLEEYENKEGFLLVGRPGVFPSGAVVIKEIKYPDQNPAVIIVDPSGTAYADNNR